MGPTRTGSSTGAPVALFAKAMESIKPITDAGERAREQAKTACTDGYPADVDSTSGDSGREQKTPNNMTKESHSNSDNSQWDSSTDTVAVSESGSTDSTSEAEGGRSPNRRRWADMEEGDMEYNNDSIGHACDTPSPSTTPQWTPRCVGASVGMFSQPPVTPVASQMRASAAEWTPGMNTMTEICPPPPPLPQQVAMHPVPMQPATMPAPMQPATMPAPMQPAPLEMPPAPQAPLNSPPLQAPLQPPLNNPPPQAPPPPAQPRNMWYRVSFLGGLELRTEPNFSATRTGVTLQHNDVFLVNQELPGSDGRVYLALADGRGWAFDDSALIPHDPSVMQGQFVQVQPTPGTPCYGTHAPAPPPPPPPLPAAPPLNINPVLGTPCHSQTHSVPSTPMSQASLSGTPMSQPSIPGIPGTPIAQPAMPGTPLGQTSFPSAPLTHRHPMPGTEPMPCHSMPYPPVEPMPGMPAALPPMHLNPVGPAPPPPPPPPSVGMPMPAPPLLQAPSPAPAPAPAPPPAAPPGPQQPVQLNSAAPAFDPNTIVASVMPQQPVQQWSQEMIVQQPVQQWASDGYNVISSPYAAFH